MNKYEKSLERIKKNLVPADDWTEEDRMHSLTVIEALEKQIPKKPTQYDSVPHNRCPVCHNAVKVFVDAHEYHYCLYCGQALDWGCKE